ncbi:MAG: TolC family protein [Nitrosomonadales bacterium]|nr:TolC family protein [Nitrosomonadales bacterium]
MPQGLSLEAALSVALSGNPNVLLSLTQVEVAQGVAQQQHGPFDLALNAQGGSTRNIQPLREAERLNFLQGGYDLRYQISDTTIAQAGVTQLFINGVQANLVATYTNNADNTFPATGTLRQGSGTVAFQLRVPIMRNAGDVASAPLRAAEIESSATRGELEFTVAQALLNSALSYWDYLGKTQRLAISRANERRGEEQLDEIRKLIAADELPEAEANLAQASLNDRRSARIAAEQALLESRRALGRTLGMSAQATMSIGDLVDAFPPYANVAINTVLRKEELTLRALELRSDLAALRQHREAAQILRDAARKNERPQLDLVLGATQNGLTEGASPGAIAPAFTRNFGPGYSANLIFQMPLGNNTARGLYRQQAAQADAQRIRISELGHSISNSIEISAYAVQRATEQLIEADAAVKTYAVSLENERTKRRLGLATLIDTLNIEDRYNNALLAAVQAHQNFAGSIARFRFETGTLLAREGDTYSARVSELLTPEVR